jgi:hypothetical protein
MARSSHEPDQALRAMTGDGGRRRRTSEMRVGAAVADAIERR